MPYPVCDDMRQFEYDGRVYFLRIKVTAQLVGQEPAGAPLPVRADLGKRIADLIRADCAEAPRPVPIRRRDPEETRALLLSSPLPPDLAAALAEEITP
jgi:hypothetical protein